MITFHFPNGLNFFLLFHRFQTTFPSTGYCISKSTTSHVQCNTPESHTHGKTPGRTAWSSQELVRQGWEAARVYLYRRPGNNWREFGRQAKVNLVRLPSSLSYLGYSLSIFFSYPLLLFRIFLFQFFCSVSLCSRKFSLFFSILIFPFLAYFLLAML